MVVSLMFKKVVNVDVNKHGKFTLLENKMSIKEIPFIRYDLKDYGEEQLEFIRSMQEVFTYSCHLVQITVEPGYMELVEKIRNTMPHVAIYLYVSVTDADVERDCLGIDKQALLTELKGNFNVDRLMLLDNSNSLHLVSANKIKQDISISCGISIRDMGICSSPLSFNGECCLSAERARELSAKYCENFECALPTANHEDMNRCGCIRYRVIESDITCPDKPDRVKKEKAVKTEKSSEVKEKDTEEKESKPKDKKKSKSLPKGMMKMWG